MHYDVVLFDLPGTMGSDGVIATISALDYLFVPIKADRLVLESTLNFATTVNDRLIRTGISNLKALCMFWNMVDRRERTVLYDIYQQGFSLLGLDCLQTRVLLTGGSMMYVDAVCKGIDDIPTVDAETRRLMLHKYETEGLEHLCAELKLLDPEYYKIVDLKNHKRVIHALEICYMTGKTYTSFRTQQKKERPFRIIKIGLTRDREELYARINQRVEQMITDGLVEEARSVYPHRALNSLNTVGYKEIFNYLDGEWTLPFAIEKIQQNSRIYSRKQMTWFKRDEEIRWFHPEQETEILAYLRSQLS